MPPLTRLVILLAAARSAAQNWATVADTSFTRSLFLSTLSPSYRQSSSSSMSSTKATASARSRSSFSLIGRTSVAYPSNAEATAVRSSANRSAVSRTGWVVAKSWSASGAL